MLIHYLISIHISNHIYPLNYMNPGYFTLAAIDLKL